MEIPVALGRKAYSDAALTQSIKDYAKWPYGIATIYAFRGELDEAFKWLDRPYAEKDVFLGNVRFTPQFDNSTPIPASRRS